MWYSYTLKSIKHFKVDTDYVKNKKTASLFMKKTYIYIY